MAKPTRVFAIPQKRIAFAVAAALVPIASSAQTTAGTLPSGGQVTSGTAAISVTGTKMQIDQTSQKAILQWDSFSIGSAAWVNFTQPSSSAIALNRVLGTNPSEIFGRLTANGQVFLSNPSGVLFAPGASVDVGGLFATTLSVSDRDFLAGNYNFYNGGNAGGVVNQGVITAGNYAALAGPQVRNDGVIVARSGTVALAAGDRVALDMVGDGLIKVSVEQAAMNASALNTGRIEADGGSVILTARSANALLDTVVNNSGVIRANSLVERNGEIVLDGGSAGVVANSGTLQAAGVDAGTQGGTITVTGDKVSVAGVIDASGDSGGGPVAIGRGASATFVGPDATIRADATRQGSGGLVETSGGYLDVRSAPQVGEGGTWLIDPFNITIVGGTGAVNNSGVPAFTPTGDSSQIGATLIANQLNGGTNVTIDTGNAGSPGTQAGDLTVNAVINKNVARASTLTLNAAHDVIFNSLVNLNSGGLTINAGHDVKVNTTVTGPSMNVVAGNQVFLNAVTQDAALNSTGGQTLSAASLSAHAESDRRAVIQNTGGNQSVTVGAGGINLEVMDGRGVAQIASNRGGTINGTQTVSTTGLLKATGGSTTAGSTNSGVFQSQTGKQTVTAGSIELRAAVTAVNTGGAFVSTNGALNVGGADQEINVATGTITIVGGELGLSNRAGLISSGNQVITGNADISLMGGGSGNGTNAATATTPANSSNAALISASQPGKTQTINAHSIALQAGSGGTDTFAAITSDRQVITATGDVSLAGGANTGESNGARIGAPTASATGTDLTLQAHSVSLKGGATASAAVIGNTRGAASPNLPNMISITASGDVVLNSGEGNGARIGAPTDDSGAGSINITATGRIALNPDNAVNASSIRTSADATLTAAIISEAPNGQILADTLALTTTGNADLGGANTIGKIGNLSAGGTLNFNNIGTLTLDATSQDAKISSSGGQIITADGLVLHAEANHAATITNTLGDQSITIGAAGIGLDVASTGQGVAQINNNSPRVNGVTVLTPGTQTVTTGGALTVVGGSIAGLNQPRNSGIFQNQTGLQSVSADSMSLAAATTGSNGGAFISNNQNGGGDQQVEIATKLDIKGGAVGSGNRAGIVSSGNQTISGGADIKITGGDSGTGTADTLTSNGGFISANNGAQAIDAKSITLQAGAGGEDTFATINAASQVITVSGDVLLKGGGATGEGGGARIGGPGGSNPGATDLTLNARNVTLTGGAATGAALGAAKAATTVSNTVTVNATGTVTLNEDVGAGAGARIGSSGTGGGDITVNAVNIALGGVANATSIRTGDNVTLNATADISEAPNGSIFANMLTTTSSGSTLLGGPNHVSSFNATSGGDVLLNNSGTLDVIGLAGASSATFTNAGAVTLSLGTAPAFLPGTLSITTTGAGADLLVTGSLFAGSGMDLDIAGTLSVVGGTPGVLANLSTGGAQNIDARGLAVTALNGGFASLSAGSQSIAITGGSVDVLSFDHGSAQVLASGPQSIAVVNGDHVNVNGASGSAFVQALAGNAQTISLTGNGRNAMTLGSSDALGSSQIVASSQSITAGAKGEAGSISIAGGAAASPASIVTFASPSGTQSISTAGQLSILGGNAAFGTSAGIFHNGAGAQNIDAGTIMLLGGGSGRGNGTFISANGGGDQVINVEAGTISVTGGAGGLSNRAGIAANGNQTITGNSNIFVTGGAGGNGTQPAGTQNSANIGSTAKSQTIDARSITVTAGGGTDAAGTITGPVQVITATEDVHVKGSSGGGDVNGARIGGSGSTNLQLTARDVVLEAGSGNGVGLGVSILAVLPNTINVHATRDVIVNSVDGVAAGARIGSSRAGLAGGDITVTADRDIRLEGGTPSASIRTLGNVTLSAGRGISEIGNGLVIASALTTNSGGATLLGGPNQVGFLNATSGGDVLFNNTGVLGVTGLSAVSNATLDNTGNVTISGSWIAGGTTSITVHSDLLINAPIQSREVLLTATSGAIQESGAGAISAETLATSSIGDTSLGGANAVSSFSATSQTGSVSLANSGPLTITSLDAANVSLATTGSITVGAADAAAPTVLFASGDFSISSAGALTVRGSDTTPGATAGIAAGGMLDIHAAQFSLLGGSALGASAFAMGGAVKVATTGDVNIVAGGGLLSQALLFSGTNVDLTVGGALRLNGSTSDSSFARVETATRDGEIRITFANRSGDYFVDGLEGHIKHGQDGFYTGVTKPAKLGDTFFVDYGF